MEYKLDIELITGWWSLGGFKLGYKHDVNRVIDETRKLITNPVYGYQTDEKLRECKLFLGRVKTTILQHEWGINCNDKEKQESIAIIDCFIEEIEALKSIWEIDRKKNEKQPDRQLKTNLTNEQRSKLFDLLVKGGFIPETDKNGFIWAMGGDKILETFNPIKWLKNKQLLRELLTSLKSYTDLKLADIERHCPILFIDIMGNAMILAKNKPVPNIDSDNLTGILNEIATI